MIYRNVCLEALGYTLPDEIVTSDQIEQRLAPLYDRLKLPAGRLELMTGIRERRFWKPGTLPGEISVQSGEKAIRVSGIDRSEIGALVHGSVCRDYLEPATASGVHHRLGLSPDCLVYDVSNACLGLLNGVVQIANMIELGQIRAGLVVGTESSRSLVETTIETLNRDRTFTRESVKHAVASLTIGSASCAMLLVDRRLSQTGNRLISAVWRANTSQNHLCRSGADEAVASGMHPLMCTNSERLMAEGIATGVATFADFLTENGWQNRDLHKTICHQVGSGHRKAMLSSLELDPARDYSTLQWLGNTGSVALPVTLATGLERGHVEPGENVGLLGIGSGIHCLMLGAAWQKTLVSSSLSSVPHTSIKATEFSPAVLSGAS